MVQQHRRFLVNILFIHFSNLNVHILRVSRLAGLGGTGFCQLLMSTETPSHTPHPGDLCFCWHDRIRGNGTTLSSGSRALKQNWVLSQATCTAEPADDKNARLPEQNQTQLRKKWEEKKEKLEWRRKCSDLSFIGSDSDSPGRVSARPDRPDYKSGYCASINGNALIGN